MNYELITAHVISMINDNSLDLKINGNNVYIDGESYILMPWRYDRNMNSLHYLSVEAAYVDKLCSYKATVVESKNADINEILCRELDVCQWLTGDKIVSVYALSSSDKAISLILKTKKDILCSINLATTLSDETTPIIKHEITGTEGMISDRCINEHIPTKDIYVFEDTKKDPTSYIDIDLYVAGFSPEETYVAENIVKLIENKELRKVTTENGKNLVACIAGVNSSLETGEVVRLEA